jgi:Mannosyltransferase putative
MSSDRMTELTLREAVERRRQVPSRYPEERFDGRGIVICAGGERYFTCAWVVIHVLRRTHGCTLPIQVWHLGAGEMSEEMRLLLLEQGVEVVDAESIVARYPARLKGGWPLKPYAIAHSRFREVLYLDADTVPLVDPQAAFAWSEFKDRGLLLWPDIVDLTATNPAWSRLGLQPTEQVSVDSCVLLVDKARAWEILDVTVLMNEHCDELYDVLYGDKDTFLLAALSLDRPFGVIRQRPFRFGWDLVQRDPAGDPFLEHRTGSKWMLNRSNRRLSNGALMPACEAALADLRKRWSGVVFHPPTRSARALAEEARLIGVRTFRYEPRPDAARGLELLPGGRIGKGAALERNWAVTERDGALLLKLYAGHREYATLEKMADGSWQGDNGAPGSDIRLEEPGPHHALSDVGSGRPSRSAEEFVRALVHPSLFAAGYDAERARGLEAALVLLNETYDDVAEQLAQQTVRLRPPANWQALLDDLAVRLARARDGRTTAVASDRMVSPALKPEYYARN